jgi:hypothetical protein
MFKLRIRSSKEAKVQTVFEIDVNTEHMAEDLIKKGYTQTEVDAMTARGGYSVYLQNGIGGKDRNPDSIETHLNLRNIEFTRTDNVSVGEASGDVKLAKSIRNADAATQELIRKILAGETV